MDLSALMAAAAERSPMPTVEVRQHNRNVIAHVDGDSAAYFCAGSENCSAGDTRRNVLSRVSHLKHISGADRVVMHLTHGASSMIGRASCRDRVYTAAASGSGKD